MVTLINIQTLQEIRGLPYCINTSPLPFRNITRSIVASFLIILLIMTGDENMAEFNKSERQKFKWGEKSSRAMVKMRRKKARE